jgi:hypothetical protein
MKVMTGRQFLEQDELGIGQLVWDNTDPVSHRIGGGSGAVSARFYPGVDSFGSLYLDKQALIKTVDPTYRDNGFGFDGGDVVIRIQGTVIARFSSIGLSLSGGLTQAAADPQYLPSRTGLAELLFPLFTDKTLIAQFNRPAFAGVDKNNLFHAYRDFPSFLYDFNGSFARGGTADIGFVRYVDKNRKYIRATGNQPRITYSFTTGKCRGLLIEPGTTNLLIQSYNLTAWPTINNIVVNLEDNPDWSSKGLNKPFSFVESSNVAEHSIAQNYTAPPAATISLSMYFEAKPFTGTRQFTLFAANPDRSQIFGANFTVGSSSAPVFNSTRNVGNGSLASYEVEYIGNNIYRIKVIGVLNPADGSGPGTYQVFFGSLGDTNGNTSLVFSPGANTGNWCLIGDAQAEQNVRVTSYLQTTTATVTRGADILTLDLSHYHFSTIEGSFDVNFQTSGVAPLNAVIFSLTDAAQTTRVDYVIGAIDSTKTIYTINSVVTRPGAATVTTALGTVNVAKSKLTISYANLVAGLTQLIIDGSKGFIGTFSLISYE